MSKLNGKWNLVVKTYMGDMRSTLELEAEGAALTGSSVDDGTGNSAAIENGVVDGDSYSYTLTVKTPVGELTNELSGSVNEDGTKLTGVSKNAMGEFEFEATRA